MNATIHPFERAGLGKAPFRFLGVERKVFQAFPGAPIQVGGSCDYCGTGISYHCHVESADGQRFKVGCDCIAKVSSKGERLLSASERAVARAKKSAAQVALADRIAAAKAELDRNPELLTDRPHSHAGMAKAGKTLRDSVVWLLANAGATGKTKACQIIERAAV